MIHDAMVLSMRHLDLPSIAWLVNNPAFAAPVRMDSGKDITAFILYPQYALQVGCPQPKVLRRCLDLAVEKNCYLLCFEEYAIPDSDIPVFSEPRGVFTKSKYIWQKFGDFGYVRRCNEELTEFDVVQYNWDRMASNPKYRVNYFHCSLEGISEEDLELSVSRIGIMSIQEFKAGKYQSCLPTNWAPDWKENVPWQVALALRQVITPGNPLARGEVTAKFQTRDSADSFVQQFIAPNQIDGKYSGCLKTQTMTTLNWDLNEYRTIVVELSTGRILDKANGNGYTSEMKAIKGWNYKHPEDKFPH